MTSEGRGDVKGEPRKWTITREVLPMYGSGRGRIEDRIEGDPINLGESVEVVELTPGRTAEDGGAVAALFDYARQLAAMTDDEAHGSAQQLAALIGAAERELREPARVIRDGFTDEDVEAGARALFKRQFGPGAKWDGQDVYPKNYWRQRSRAVLGAVFSRSPVGEEEKRDG
jgi:hypothetical protein